MRSFLMIFLAISMLCAPVMVGAASAQSNSRLSDSLSFLNRTKPLQNPRFDRAKDVLDKRVVDNSNRVVGDVNDILLSNNGNISSINADLNRLRIRGDIYLNYTQMRMRTISNAYSLNIQDDQLEDLLPTLLNNIESAAGNEDTFSLKKFDGARVVAEDGRRLGKVTDVLFANMTSRAQALYVDLNYKSIRGETIAIPYNIARFEPKARVFDVVLSNADADAIIEYARENK